MGNAMRFHLKKVPDGCTLRIRDGDGRDRKVYAIKIFNLVIGVSFGMHLVP
jgi:hypothetical protein